ncbi:MAG: DUF4143 domain-containing protein [Clostridia bacterium]|nr:DUF4143 domain-containing protein [Clostridia bacterium]
MVDSAIRNAVLMHDDLLLNSEEMGYMIETTVFRHIITKYSINHQLGYYREQKGDKDREIDIVAKSFDNTKYIEVKYQEDPKINSNNPILHLPKKGDDVFIITKKDSDYSITELENGVKLLKIPAFAFLYLLGKEEYKE